MSFFRIFPAKLYEGNGGENSKVKSAPFNITAGTTGTMVAANSTKKIRMMGILGTSNSSATPGIGYVKNGSGGSSLIEPIVFDLNTKPTLLNLPIIDSGYCETDVNTALALQVFTTDVRGTVFYVEYTPD